MWASGSGGGRIWLVGCGEGKHHVLDRERNAVDLAVEGDALDGDRVELGDRQIADTQK